MRILVIGAGGVGGYLGARLLQAGEDLTFVARGEHARVLRERGLTISGLTDTETVRIAKVSTLEEARGPFDVVLIAVKWRDLTSACDELFRLLAPSGVVVPLLNGLDSEDVVARYVGAQRTLGAVAYMSAGLVRPGEIYVHGPTRVGLAPYRPGQDADVAELARRFDRAGVPVRRTEDGLTMLWEKMVWNAPFNALCALTRKDAGTVLEQAEALVRDAMREVIAVACADGAALSEAYVELMVAITRREFPRTQPSMLQDVLHGVPTEVEILQGAVLARGRAHGVATPVLSMLTTLVRLLG